jgi:hypothetical protein
MVMVGLMGAVSIILAMMHQYIEVFGLSRGCLTLRLTGLPSGTERNHAKFASVAPVEPIVRCGQRNHAYQFFQLGAFRNRNSFWSGFNSFPNTSHLRLTQGIPETIGADQQTLSATTAETPD